MIAYLMTGWKTNQFIILGSSTHSIMLSRTAGESKCYFCVFSCLRFWVTWGGRGAVLSNVKTKTCREDFISNTRKTIHWPVPRYRFCALVLYFRPHHIDIVVIKIIWIPQAESHIFGDEADCTWWVVPSISIGVLRLCKNTGGHLVFPDGSFLLICTEWNVGGATRRAQNPEKREMVNTITESWKYTGWFFPPFFSLFYFGSFNNLLLQPNKDAAHYLCLVWAARF